MGAGKSTESKKVAVERNAILISEDEWLGKLYPDEISTLDDYVYYSKRLKSLLRNHIEGVLRAGTNVVMDFPANSKKQRDWFKRLITNAGSPYEFYYLEVSDEVCLKQIVQRRVEQPERAIFDTEAVFNQVSEYFETPEESEGLEIRCR